MHTDVCDLYIENAKQIKREAKDKWIKDPEKDEIIGLLEKLPNLIQDEDHEGEMKQKSIKLSNHSFDEHGGAKRMFNKIRHWISKKAQEYAVKEGFHFKRKMATSYRGIIVISGIRCICKADYIHNKIIGQLSCSKTNKQFKINFEPIQFRQNPDIITELKRFYFDALPDNSYVHFMTGSTPPRKLRLCLLSEEEYLADAGGLT